MSVDEAKTLTIALIEYAPASRSTPAKGIQQIIVPATGARKDYVSSFFTATNTLYGTKNTEPWSVTSHSAENFDRHMANTIDRMMSNAFIDRDTQVQYDRTLANIYESAQEAAVIAYELHVTFTEVPLNFMFHTPDLILNNLPWQRT